MVRRDGVDHEITTFRSDHDYADFRRPHRVEFTGSIEADLARRDFTINAIAWGAIGAARRRLAWSIPTAAARTSPRARSGPSASREPGSRRTRSGSSGRSGSPRPSGSRSSRRRSPRSARTAPLVAHLSGERVATELTRILAAERPSVGLRLLADTGRARRDLARSSALQRGVAPEQDPGRGPLGSHAPDGRRAPSTGRTSALGGAAPRHRQAGDRGRRPLLPPRVGRGGASPAASSSACTRARATRRIGSSISSASTCSATSRTGATARSGGSSAKIGPAAIEDLFALREADNIGSGVAAGRRRPRRPPRAGRGGARGGPAARPVRRSRSTARDLIAELGLDEGPELGRILGELFERVVEDPQLNDAAATAARWRATSPAHADAARAPPVGILRPRTSPPIRENEPAHADGAGAHRPLGARTGGRMPDSDRAVGPALHGPRRAGGGRRRNARRARRDGLPARRAVPARGARRPSPRRAAAAWPVRPDHPRRRPDDRSRRRSSTRPRRSGSGRSSSRGWTRPDGSDRGRGPGDRRRAEHGGRPGVDDGPPGRLPQPPLRAGDVGSTGDTRSRSLPTTSSRASSSRSTPTGRSRAAPMSRRCSRGSAGGSPRST